MFFCIKKTSFKKRGLENLIYKFNIQIQYAVKNLLSGLLFGFSIQINQSCQQKHKTDNQTKPADTRKTGNKITAEAAHSNQNSVRNLGGNVFQMVTSGACGRKNCGIGNGGNMVAANSA